MDLGRARRGAETGARWTVNVATVLFFAAMAGVVGMSLYAVVWLIWDAIFG